MCKEIILQGYPCCWNNRAWLRSCCKNKKRQDILNSPIKPTLLFCVVKLHPKCELKLPSTRVVSVVSKGTRVFVCQNPWMLLDCPQKIPPNENHLPRSGVSGVVFFPRIASILETCQVRRGGIPLVSQHRSVENFNVVGWPNKNKRNQKRLLFLFHAWERYQVKIRLHKKTYAVILKIPPPGWKWQMKVFLVGIREPNKC